MALAISETSICNAALAKLGDLRITSVDEDSKAARACKDRLPFLRNEVLEAHSWKFARKRDTLPALSEEPSFGWDYKFNLPSDYINMVQDPNELDVVSEYIIEGREILANDDTINVLYTFEETNYARWSYVAAEALAWRLAAELAYLVTQSKEVAKLMFDGYEAWLKQARFNDSRQQPLRGPYTETFLGSRN